MFKLLELALGQKSQYAACWPTESVLAIAAKLNLRPEPAYGTMKRHWVDRLSQPNAIFHSAETLFLAVSKSALNHGKNQRENSHGKQRYSERAGEEDTIISVG